MGAASDENPSGLCTILRHRPVHELHSIDFEGDKSVRFAIDEKNRKRKYILVL
jgi:hypothetical protein